MAFTIPEGKSKADYVQKKFSEIARKYDLFNDIVTQGMHRYWKRFLVKKARLNPGDQVLDICCGTGDITQLLQKKTGKQGTTLGLDFSSGMLAVAAERDQTGLSSFLQGDAAVLPIISGSMDAVTVGYGLRNLIDISPCLEEVYRVLKPGGRFLCLDMGKVKIPIIREIFAFYFFKIVPRIGKLIYPGEDMFDYFPESSVEYPSQERLAEILREHGYIDVSYHDFHFGSVTVHYAVKKQD
ncbi:MAG: bifunctional demethylmenaquinone methyltransferase/2-methoxy-6-polyprenyl-1,4-benzoquinol methylase UbiE [Proteobacteria bacterium]|nr:bifunctional demethylmenaquinone methyltransferase/2-methoxy-6-polyprenyl-1,4-benzoquinol methylase UbiE [Pseudomonadota bacterium]